MGGVQQGSLETAGWGQSRKGPEKHSTFLAGHGGFGQRILVRTKSSRVTPADNPGWKVTKKGSLEAAGRGLKDGEAMER